MGRKRQTRKQTDRVNSKTSLNSGNVSSDSESETSLVARKESQTVCGQKTQTNGSADTDCYAPTHPTGASINHTSFGQHCSAAQTVQAERAHTSFDRSVSQKTIPAKTCNLHSLTMVHNLSAYPRMIMTLIRLHKDYLSAQVLDVLCHNWTRASNSHWAMRSPTSLYSLPVFLGKLQTLIRLYIRMRFQLGLT